MPFLNLPNEMLYEVVEELGPKDLNSLLQTNRVLNHILTPLFHDLAMKDYDHLPALIWAVKKGHEPLVRLLLEKGVDVDTMGPGVGMTPLMFAVRSGNMKIIRLLIKKGAEINRMDARGHSPLILAVRKRKIGVCSVLLDMGADANCYCAEQKRPSYESNPDRAYPKISFECWAPPLHWAVIKDHVLPPKLAVVRLLLEKGAHVDGLNSRGETALYELARTADYNGSLRPEIAKLLLKAGADVNFKHPSEGDAVLHKAIQGGRGCVDFLRVLLEGASLNIDILDGRGETPLGKAIESMDLGLVAILNKHGADMEHTCYKARSRF